MAGFGEAVEFEEEVAADAGEEVVALERWVGGEGVDEVEGGLRAVGHGDGDGAVELDDGGWGEVGELGVEGTMRCQSVSSGGGPGRGRRLWRPAGGRGRGACGLSAR